MIKAEEVPTTAIPTRDAIMRTAVDMFALHGYSAASVQQIADAAGANKAMIYYYFDSKDGLYRKLLESGIGFFQEAVDVAVAATGVESKVRNFLAAYLCVAVESPELTRIIYREIVGAGETSSQVVADNFRENVLRFADLLAAARDAGEIRADVDTTLAAYTLFGMANIFITRFIVTRKPIDVPELVEHITTMFLNGVKP